MSCHICNGLCRQGRNCPLNTPTDVPWHYVFGVCVLLACLVGAGIYLGRLGGAILFN